MADRLNIDEFFTALKSQRKEPFIDTAESRRAVYENVKSLTRHYPIQDRWPVLDLESSYESYLNNRSDLVKLIANYGYSGIINLDGFDEKYTMDEWFGDFVVQYRLQDIPWIREEMLKKLSTRNRWKASELDDAYHRSTNLTITNLLKSFFR